MLIDLPAKLPHSFRVSSSSSSVGPDAALRLRKPRSIASARIQTLARTGADSGLLTPREVKEVCMAVLAEARKPKAT